MLTAAIAAPKISFETFAMISSPRVGKQELSTRRRLDYIAANSSTLSRQNGDDEVHNFLKPL
jgi:hypothetical protein